MKIAISRANHDAMLSYAEAEPDREVCGLLLGTADEIETLLPCKNVSDAPEISFEIDPASLIAAHKAARAGAKAVIGCYHSHPNGAARPSEQDRMSAAGSGEIWIIIAKGSLNAWSITAGQITECTLEIIE